MENLHLNSQKSLKFFKLERERKNKMIFKSPKQYNIRVCVGFFFLSTLGHINIYLIYQKNFFNFILEKYLSFIMEP